MASQNKQKRKAPRRITPDYLRNAGLYYLRRFAASRAGFEAVLLRKVKKSCRHHADQNYEDCAAMVRRLALDFERSGLLDDASYARGLATSLRRAGKSKKAVAYKLATKGLPGDLAEKALQDYDADNHAGPDEAEFQAALVFARRKKIGPYAREKTTGPKAMAALARAGFSYDMAKKILGMNPGEDSGL